MRPVKLVCLDIDGTLTQGIGGPVLPGVTAAIQQLRRHLPVRLVTNATSRTRGHLLGWLQERDLLRNPEELVTPASTARRVLSERRQAAGVLLADEATLEDFTWFQQTADGPAVLLATEAHDWSIERLQPAFRALLQGATLYALQQNRYFRRRQELVTDLGPVAAFLAYAAGAEINNLGKPSPLLFQALGRKLDVALEDMAMVGDDAEFDVAGSQRLGLQGVLVRTGKFRSGDEKAFQPSPSAVIDSVADLPAWLGLA